jgi:signal transduction histidine kinase
MTKSIGLKILLLIMVFLVFLFSGFFYFTMMQFNKDSEVRDMDTVTQANKSFNNLLEEETRMLKMGLTDTMENNDIKKLFLEKDRQKLYDYVKPLFNKQKEEFGLTHWLFHEPDRNVFLRVHSPDLFGMPTQERTTFNRAEESKSWGIGMELGQAGFALRVVHPYYQDSKLIGYMEYGEDISPLLERMKDQTGNNVAMLIKKTNINPEQWQSFRESLNLRNNYDDMQNFVMLGTTDEKLVDTKNKCFTEQSLDHLPKTGTLLNEFSLDNKNYDCGGFAMIDANGGEIGAVVVMRDITAEIAASNKTKYTILTISILLTLLFSFVLITISNKTIVRPLRKLTAAANEIEGGNLSKIIPVESQDEIGILAVAFNNMRARLKYSYESLEELVRQKTGKLSETLEEAQKKNISLENSKRAMLNVLEDFEESKKIIEQEKIKYESERDRSEGILRYLHSIGEGVVATDAKGTLIFVNLTAAKMISYAEGSPLIGKKYSSAFSFVLGRNEKKIVIDPVGEVLKNSSIFVLPRDCCLVVGSDVIPISGSFAPIIKDDKTLGVVSVFQDITERYNLEREKDDFISIAAHQLRTPLSGIRWVIESLLEGDDGDLPEEAKKSLEQIYENNQRLVMLVNDLLDVSRINMGKSKEEPTLVNICTTLKEAVETMKGLAEERGVAISYEKECPLNPEIKIGSRHFFQALENIISNAIKYTPRGGNVKTAIDFEKDKVVISISDTGIGIPKNDQENIFKKFFRSSNATLKETEGSGLGLNVVKSFIEESGGKIWFESEEGKGTTFFVEFPVVKPEIKTINI